ncbi:MAG: TolC family protein [Myxococcales bacterium]|nr:TolC family protein [Myxococcales bacterium]
MFALGVLCAMTATQAASAQPSPPATAPEGAPATPPGGARVAPTLPSTLTPVAGGLTAEQVARRVLETSLQVRAAHANTQAAEAASTEAALQMIPQLSLTARYTRLSPVDLPRIGVSPGVPIFVGNRGVGCVTANGTVTASPPGAGGTLQCPEGSTQLQQPASPGFSFPVILDNALIRGTLTIPISDIALRLSRVYAAAGLTAEARRLDEEAARSQAATDGRVAFYEYMRGLGQRAVAEEALATAQAHARDLGHFVQAGTLARVELLRVEAQVAEAERFVLAAREGVSLAEAQLRLRMHVGSDQALTLGESLEERIENPRNLNDLLSQAAHDRPEAASLERQLRALGHNLGATRAGMLPSLAAVGNVDIANPNQRIIPAVGEFRTTWDVSLQLSWSPTQALVTNATANRIAAQRDALVASLEQLREGIELELRAAYLTAQTASSAVEVAERQVAAAEESYRVRRERFNAGVATSSDLTDAENDLLRARFALVNAHVDHREALARLRRATGRREG